MAISKTVPGLPIPILGGKHGDLPLERSLHQRSRGLFHRDEWFRDHREIRAFIAAAMQVG